MQSQEETRDRCRAIAKLVLGHRYTWSKEEDLQEALARLLLGAGVAHEREKPLSDGGRIDFLVESRIGLEVKIKGSPSEVVRQLVRYCDCPEIEGLVLVTGRARLGKIPSTIRNKPVAVAGLWRGHLL